MEGEVEDLVRKAVEMAKAGDVQMLKFLLSRMLPRERPIKFDLPIMNFADDAVEALGSIAQAVSEGTITPGEGAALATLMNSYARAIDIADLVARMDALEAKIKGEFAPCVGFATDRCRDWKSWLSQQSIMCDDRMTLTSNGSNIAHHCTQLA